MKTMLQRSPFRILFSRLRWYLTLTYDLATLAAIFLLGWWGLLVGIIYLQHANPQLTWWEIAGEQVIPALRVIFPSMLLLIIPATLISAYFGFLNARWLDIRLNGLRKAVQAWKRGDFSVKIQDGIEDEIGFFGQELNSMAFDFERLLQFRQDLAVLEERNQIARDLHDAVKQQITAAAFQICAAKRLLGTDPQAAFACLGEAEELNHAAHQELNAIIFELRPVGLQAGNLTQSLSEYASGWAHQNQVTLDLRLPANWNPDPRIQGELFRFLQEALSNIARHSHATHVEISLVAAEDPRKMDFCIQDNGCGFDINSKDTAGFGHRTMGTRAQQIGGQFIIESQTGHGTRVGIRLPIEEAS